LIIAIRPAAADNLLKFSTDEENAMATGNYSVPDDVKDAFKLAELH